MGQSAASVFRVQPCVCVFRSGVCVFEHRELFVKPDE